MKILSATVLLGFVLLHAIPSHACSCLLSPTGCDRLTDADAIFLGTATSKQLGENRPVNGAVSSVVPSLVRFSVTEAYNGVTKSEVEVATTEGCCACGYPFQVGHEYLVYAYQQEGKLTTSICTATQPARTATALIQQLQARKSALLAASVFGEVKRMPQDARVEGKEKEEPLAGIKIRVLGSNGVQFLTESDSGGAYEFQNLPPDTYEVLPLLPSGLNTREQLSKEPLKVAVQSGTSCQRDIWVYPDGRITGRIITPDGQPVPGFVTVEPADPEERRASIQRGGLPGFDTGSDARFELNLLWPGQYRLRFAPKVGSQVDFRRRLYYPQIIDVSEGQHVDDIEFVMKQTTP
jgi:hypothetical protein